MKTRSTIFVSLTILSAVAALAEENEWKLKPLEHNQPGLVVDLGVGLWAWPMPMDYDRDGDIDLLVACPDKPSGGVYYFENPTQDPEIKMPVFKAGVRLGKAGHNYQVSYVDSQPRMMKPGFEFLRDKSTGEFRFERPTRIYPRANVHDGAVRANMWRYVDYDGDGDQDMIVGVGDWSDYGWDHAYDSSGRWRNGPLHGYVYLIENQSSNSTPRYSTQPRKLLAGGGVIDVYGWPSPNFCDFDGDGDLDLLCGEFLDCFNYFENIGTRAEPHYAAGSRLLDDVGNPLVMELQMITPTAFDWDADGDFDLIVGDEDGRVALIENMGKRNGNQPVFKAPSYFQQEASTLKFGALATPFAYDWDSDGDQDILCGCTAGTIGIFENLGADHGGKPRWSAPTLVSAQQHGTTARPFRIMAGTSGSIQGPCEAKWGYTTISVADWDADNDPDILYNSIWSRVGMLRNDNGTLVKTTPFEAYESPPNWLWWKTKSHSSLSQWRTTPIAVDFDQDGGVDLVALDQEGFLVMRSQGGAAQRLFVDEDGMPLRLNHKSCGGSGRVKLAVVDWDSDSRMDLLVNSENATWYRNCCERKGKIVLKKVGNLARRNVAGHTSSPAVCDFDLDGKPDLLVGAENGRIYHIKHDDCIQYSDVQLVARPARQIRPPRFAGLVREEFVFTDVSFPQCHASTICETSRGLVAAWFGGTEEKAKDVGVWVSYHDGSGWSSPKQWADGIQHAGHRHPCWNPVLFHAAAGNATLLFFKVGPDPQNWWGEMMVSYDRGRTFRDRRRLPEGIDGPVRCKPILSADGQSLLCGSSTEFDGWRVHFERVSLSEGQPQGVWQRTGPINAKKEADDQDAFNAIQPTFLRHADGQLQVLCRTQEGVIVSSISNDDGQSWSKLEKTNLPNPNSGIDVVTLRDGRHLLIYNHLGSGKSGWGRRGLLNLAISSDGIEWRRVAVLEQEQGAEFSYPAIIQASSGEVHMTYTWKRQRIKHVVLDPTKIKVGAALSIDSW